MFKEALEEHLEDDFDSDIEVSTKDYDGTIGEILNDKYKPTRKLRPLTSWDEDGNLIFDINMGKRKEKDDRINYSKKFSREQNLLKRALKDQSRFTDSLQRIFNISTGANSKNLNDLRPLNKNDVELANAIASARSNYLSIIKELGSNKKTIADFEFKQRQALMKGIGSSSTENTSPGSFGSSILDGILNARKTGGILDESSTSTQNEVEENPDDITFDFDVSAGIKYEGKNNTTMVVLDKESGDWEFQTFDENANIIPDYPNPLKTKININETEMNAKDAFGSVYPLMIR
jgi:hypothetical protein